ncbi:translation initiation factor IF-2-like [Benincasa hispida]|uniref:translation initiation factor IF-2-like n=1 Tax=Benincasa hispida TaxID=102211 RepID=UPI0018FFCC25|nr:translation initiation factor IF-2-like [Benincasa hispida]
MGKSSESTPLPTPAVSTESEKKRQDDKEVFGSILSNLEKEGGLPEAGVMYQPLLTEEVMVEETEKVVEEETRRSTLVIMDPKETTQVESYEGPIRVALEEVAAEKQLEEAEEKKKKKKKSKGKKIGKGEPSHHRKAEKKIKEKEDEEDEEAKLKKKQEKSERKERRREERRLKKEEGYKPRKGWKIDLHKGGQG